ncbi:hypothetical protein SVAN01_01079 [Stagonosporopsis vannaccii]|nr:hypothetical protein SVAN01_01079 [Stagonosporopsis vannaccii]
MPTTQPQPSGSAWRQPKSSSKHTAIVVGVLIGVLGIVAVTLLLWDQSRKRGVKKGFRTKNLSTSLPAQMPSWQTKDSELETGVIHEPLPVYQKKPNAQERST